MGTPERIAFDARYVNDQYHGIGRYAFRLLEAMVAAAPDLTFIVYRGRGRDTRFKLDALSAQPNVEFRAAPWPLYWPHEQVIWPRLLRESRADVFHSPYFVAPLFATCPVIITVHDLIFDRYPEYMPWGWSRPYYAYYGWLMRQGTRRAHRILAVSRATSSDLTRYYGVPPDKVMVIPAGADPSLSRVMDADRLREIRRRYALERPFVLAVGTRRPHKNLARLVRAFVYAKAHATHQLVFAGPGDPRFPDKARQTARELGMNEHVRFLEWVPEADLPALYTLADLVVVPSLVEGFGLPALEAMACGTPVAAANNTSLPEIVGEAGALFDPLDVKALADVLRELLHDPARRQRQAEAGQRRAAMFNWTNVAAQALRTITGLSVVQDDRQAETKKDPLDALRVS